MSDAAAIVSRAELAEREGRYLEAFELAHQALAAVPDDAGALNVLGRLCHIGGDLVSAIGLQQLALRVAPAHAQARIDLAAALEAIPEREGGRAALLDAFARAPDLREHQVPPGALPQRADFAELRALLERAIAADPSLAQAHAALGNLLGRHGYHDAAIVAYRRGLLLEPDDAAMHLALSELAYEIGEEGTAARHRAEALARVRIYGPGTSAPHERCSVLVLAAPGPWSANVALEFMLDAQRFDLHRLYLTGEPPAAWEVPPHDVIFNAIGESEAAQRAIASAAHLLAAHQRPALNLPANLAKTARPALHASLAGIARVTSAGAARFERTHLRAAHPDLGALHYPLLIRPVDSHGGRGLERIGDVRELAAYLERIDVDRYDVCAFMDYRSGDGFYRKYRIIFVDGVAYPYHLAIAPEWMVHYRTAPMAEHEWMQKEEARFLSAPESVFETWDRSLPAIAAAIGLDYFGIDATLTGDGDLLVFEADAATWIHNHDTSAPFAYKAAPVQRIFEAVTALIARRAGR